MAGSPSRSRKSPKLCRHKASGQAYVRLDGKHVYLGAYDDPATVEKYHRLLAEYHARGGQRQVDADQLTVVELCARYLEHAGGYYRRPDGRQTHEVQSIAESLRPLRELYGSENVANFSPVALKVVRQRMIDNGLARSTINTRVKIIRRMFKWGVGEGLVDPMIHHGLTAIDGLKRGRTEARETDPVKPVPEAHVDAALEYVNPHIGAMIRIQRLTGMRPAEVCDMTTAAIDTDATVWTYAPVHHKTSHHGHARTIYIGPRAQEVLRPFLRADLAAAVFNPREAYAQQRAADASEN